jgi:RNAse (barnase) inhibitor barstar
MQALENIYYLKNKPEVIITSLILKENQYHLKELFYLISKIEFAKEFHLSIAGFDPSNKKSIKSIPDFEDLKRDFNKTLKLSKKYKLNLIIRDIPNCITKDTKIPHNDFLPLRKGYKHFGLKDYEVPIYMQKKKPESCMRCVYYNSCNGFFRTYIEGGFIKLTPLSEEL